MNKQEVKPLGIVITAVVMLGFLLRSCIALVPSIRANTSLRGYVYSVLAFFVIALLALWDYWRGKNSGRRLVLAYSACNVWFSLIWDNTYLTRWAVPRWNYGLAVNTLEFIFYAYLLYWLNTPDMKAFFEKPGPWLVRGRLLTLMEQFAELGVAFLLLPFGMLLGACYSFIRTGLSNIWLLVLSTAGPAICASVLVGTYFRLKKEEEPKRKLVFFVAVWTFLFGLLLITEPSPLRLWGQYYGGAMTADRRLEFYENMEMNSLPEFQSQNQHEVEASYATAEKWHLWGIGVAEGFGPASPLLAETLEDAGDFYEARSKFANALPLYERSVTAWERAFGAGNRVAARTRSKLTEATSAVEAIRAKSIQSQ